MTKKNIIITALVGLITLSAFTAARVWNADKAHAELGFTVNHLGISDVSGYITDFETSITTSKEDFSDAVFELKANTASIYTKVDQRDQHLKSADFFDVEKYPSLTFKSTSIKKDGKNHYKLTGDLTIKDVTRQVTMDLTYNGTVDNPMSQKATAGFKLTGTIKRSDFNFGPDFPAPIISDEVRIEANGEFTE